MARYDKYFLAANEYGKLIQDEKNLDGDLFWKGSWIPQKFSLLEESLPYQSKGYSWYLMWPVYMNWHFCNTTSLIMMRSNPNLWLWALHMANIGQEQPSIRNMQVVSSNRVHSTQSCEANKCRIFKPLFLFIR